MRKTGEMAVARPPLFPLPVSVTEPVSMCHRVNRPSSTSTPSPEGRRSAALLDPARDKGKK